jgi:Zn-dependent oligopeptidase
MALNFNFKDVNCDTLEMMVEDYIKTTNDLVNNITSLDSDKVNFNSTFKQLLNLEHTNFGFLRKFLSIISNFYEDDKLNNLSIELKKKLMDFDIKFSFNKLLFNKLKEATQVLDFKTMTIEEIKYVEDTMLNYKRSGIELDDSNIERLYKSISNLAIEFQSNNVKYTKEFAYTKDELKGVPERWFTKEKLLDEDSQTYKVTLSYPDYFPIMEYCDSEKIRFTMYDEYCNRCANTNDSIFSLILKDRHELANRLGYDTFADYATQKKLIGNGKNAIDFLNNLNTVFDSQYYEDFNNLVKFSKNYKPNPLLKNTLDKWDLSYYGRLMKENECNIDKNILTDYFPLNHVIKATMTIYEKLLGLSFNEIETTNKWHNDVKLFSVADTKTNNLLGHFFLDLYPRKNKYGHAAIFPIYPSFKDEKGNQTLSLCAMVCNFEREGCISFDNTKTFFHEFGHIMHFTCGRTQLAQHNSFNTESDAVEIPSTMFELWCTEKDSLEILSCHKDTKKPLDSETIGNLKKFLNFNFSLGIKRQLLLGMFDLKVHTYNFNDDKNNDFSCEKIWNSLDNSLTGHVNKNKMMFHCSFGHIVSGYSAGYYGYLLSESYADHIFCKLFKKNVLNPENGMKLRKIFFEQGSTKSTDVLFHELVGERLNPQYFLEIKKN